MAVLSLPKANRATVRQLVLLLWAFVFVFGTGLLATAALPVVTNTVTLSSALRTTFREHDGEHARMLRRTIVSLAALLAVTGILLNTAAVADTTGGSARVRFSGNLRSYYFTRHFQQGIDQTAFALGGNLHADAPLGSYLSAGATYGSVTQLSMLNSDPALVDATLPGAPLSTLEEAYLRYHGGRFSATIGRQKITTPWAHPSDSRIIPNTFQGLSANVNVSQWMTTSVFRMVRYKNRTSSTFEANDLLSNNPTAGFLAVGDVYNRAATSAQAWFYDFYGTAAITYVDATQRLTQHRAWSPYIGLQYVSENGDTRRLPAKIRAQGYGINIGLKSERADISLALNHVPFHNGAYKNGGIAAPYTYADTDPLYTTITGEGLTDKGAGHANRLAATLWSSQNRARLTAARAAFYLYGPSTFASNHVLSTNVDLTYFLGNGKRGEQFRGLSVRDRWIDIDTPGPPFTFIYNRAQLEYDF